MNYPIFTKTTLSSNVTWTSVISNNNGNILYTIGTNKTTLDNYLAKSTDSGKTWKESVIGNNKKLSNIDCNNTGKYVIYAQDNILYLLNNDIPSNIVYFDNINNVSFARLVDKGYDNYYYFVSTYSNNKGSIYRGIFAVEPVSVPIDDVYQSIIPRGYLIISATVVSPDTTPVLVYSIDNVNIPINICCSGKYGYGANYVYATINGQYLLISNDNLQNYALTNNLPIVTNGEITIECDNTGQYVIIAYNSNPTSTYLSSTYGSDFKPLQNKDSTLIYGNTPPISAMNANGIMSTCGASNNTMSEILMGDATVSNSVSTINSPNKIWLSVAMSQFPSDGSGITFDGTKLMIASTSDNEVYIVTSA